MIDRVWWEDDPARSRLVERLCLRCGADAHFHIVSPQGIAHMAAEYNEGYTQCGIDATGLEWWWRT